jgi:4-hydroxy 2-oxovalerate aldolase
MRVTIADSSLRDGMHSVAHRFKPQDVALLAGHLDRAGVDVVEVTHGDGVAGSSIQYGRAEATDEQLVEAAVSAVDRAAIAVLLLPGIGTLRRLKELRAIGASVVRVATHCTEADIAQQHLSWAKENDMRSVGFLMMSHMISAAELAEQAALMEGYGADVVYVVDSAGALLPRQVAERVTALRERLTIEVGFHAHNNLGCAIGNALAAADAGATWLDGSIRGLGAGAGNAATEVLCAALDRADIETNVDVFALMDVAEEIAVQLVPRFPIIDRSALVLGYAGVYSSFHLHAERAAAKYGVHARDVLVELGRRRIVGGQEDMIIEVAAELAAREAQDQ